MPSFRGKGLQFQAVAHQVELVALDQDDQLVAGENLGVTTGDDHFELPLDGDDDRLLRQADV